MKKFYRKHKTSIVMLAPLFIGVAFFAYSAISALRVVEQTKIFEEVENVQLQIGNFELQEINEKTNSVEWSLTAKQTQASPNQDQAEVDEPNLTYYDSPEPISGKPRPRFRITSKKAFFNKSEQEVNLYDEVVVKTSDGKYIINSGKLKFKEESPYLVVSDRWNLVSKSGYRIEGDKGLIEKSFKSIISQGNSKLSKGSGAKPINIIGNQVRLELDSSQPVIASGNASLEISKGQSLNAEEIIIYDSGMIKAHTAVNVKAANLNCFSENLRIEVNRNKKPRLAIFTGNPYIIQGGSTIYADTIRYDFKTEQAKFEGNIHSE